MQPCNLSQRLALATLLTVSGAAAANATVINFQSLTGPTTYAAAGNAQTLLINTTIGVVTITGGVVLTNTTNLPANQTSIYGTALNAASLGITTGTGFSNPIVITFPTVITNFFLNVLNGNTQTTTYQVADNAGHSRSFDLVPNLNSGNSLVGFAAVGNVITIGATTGQTTPGGMTVDFFIDNLTFDEALPPTLRTPEPASFALLAAGLLGLAHVRRRQSDNTRLTT